MDAIGYIRVSRVDLSKGDSFLSPDLQREKILKHADDHGHVIVRWEEDLHVSGGTMNRPGFRAAMDSVRKGEVKAIIVAKFDRFGRTVSGALAAFEELESLGASLISVHEGVDPTTSMGQFMLRLLFSMAEFERDLRTEGWREVRASAIDRGIFIGATVPYGYKKGADRSLVIDPVEAEHVRTIFIMRSSSKPYSAIGEALPGEWSPATLASMVRNRTYLGEVRHGDLSNPDAHEPIVGHAIFKIAQQTPFLVPRTKGGAQQLLTGILRCASCGFAMTGKPHQNPPVYTCQRNHAAGRCPAPTAIRIDRADKYVLALAQEEIKNSPMEVLTIETPEYQQARADHIEAALRFESYDLDDKARDIRGEELHLAGLKARKEVLDIAKARLDEAIAQGGIQDAPEGFPSASEMMAGDLEVGAKRNILSMGIQGAFVRRGRGAPETRIRIVWTDDPKLTLSRRGVKTDLQDFGYLFEAGVGARRGLQ